MSFPRRLYVVAITALLTSYVADCVKCYHCASRDLRGKWYLTGLPHEISNTQLLTPNCEDGLSSLNSIEGAIVECSSLCMTLLLDKTLLGSNGKVTIRGCHDTLTGVKPKELTPTCQVGVLPYAFDDGSGQKLNKFTAMLSLCSAAADPNTPCNSEVSTILERSNCRPAQGTPPEPHPVHECHECLGSDATSCESHETKCQGAYCYKSVVTIGSHAEVVKGCSDVNVFQIDSCARGSSKTFLQTRSLLDVETETCFCNSAVCNTATTITLKKSGSFFKIFSILNFFFFAIIFH